MNNERKYKEIYQEISNLEKPIDSYILEKKYKISRSLNHWIYKKYNINFSDLLVLKKYRTRESVIKNHEKIKNYLDLPVVEIVKLTELNYIIVYNYFKRNNIKPTPALAKKR